MNKSQKISFEFCHGCNMSTKQVWQGETLVCCRCNRVKRKEPKGSERKDDGK